MASRINNLRRLGDIEVDLEKKIIWINNAPSGLPVKAVELLCVLIENAGDVVSKEDLLKRVWQDTFVEEGVLPQNIYTLRKIFKHHGLGDHLIQTVPRRGYRFVEGRSFTEPAEITIDREILEECYVARSEYFDESAATVPQEQSRPAARKVHVPTVAAIGALAIIIVSGLGFILNRSAASSKTPQGLTSIAVAPFSLISDKPETSTAAQRGFAEALIFRLKHIRDIKVSEIKEIEQFFGAESDPLSLARSLGYDSVLTGTVRIEDANLRINFELLSASDGSKRFSESFTASRGPDTLGEDSVALRLARKIDIYVAEMRDAASVPPGTLDQEMTRTYVLAQKLPREFDLNRREEAVELMNRVVAAAPNWANGHAKLAEALAQTDSDERCKVAESSASRALELDPRNAVAYVALGTCSSLALEVRKAEDHFRRAVELDPTYAPAQVELGKLLSYQRRFTEAEVYLTKGLEMKPLWPFYNFVRCQLYYFDKKFERAISDCEQALRLEPGYILAQKQLYWIHVIRHRWDKVRENAFGQLSDEEMRRDPFARRLLEGDIAGYWRMNLEWRKTTKRRQHSPMAIAAYHSLLSEIPETLDLLEQAAREKHYQVRYLHADPIWDSVRTEPRYIKMVTDLGLALP